MQSSTRFRGLYVRFDFEEARNTPWGYSDSVLDVEEIEVDDREEFLMEARDAGLCDYKDEPPADLDADALVDKAACLWADEIEERAWEDR